MQFETVIQNDTVVVVVTQKRATAEFAREFREYLFELAEQRTYAFYVVDLQEVLFMDSFFLGAIVSGLKKIRSMGGDLVLSAVNKSVVSVLDIMNLQNVMSVYSSTAEAVHHFTKPNH